MTKDGQIHDEFLDEQLITLSILELPWYIDIVNLGEWSVSTQG